jgi:hypothetical protein
MTVPLRVHFNEMTQKQVAATKMVSGPRWKGLLSGKIA